MINYKDFVNKHRMKCEICCTIFVKSYNDIISHIKDTNHNSYVLSETYKPKGGKI